MSSRELCAVSDGSSPETLMPAVLGLRLYPVHVPAVGLPFTVFANCQRGGHIKAHIKFTCAITILLVTLIL